MSRADRLRAKLELAKYKSEALDRILLGHNVVLTDIDIVNGQLIQDYLVANVDQRSYTFITLDANYTGSKMVWKMLIGFDNVADAVHFKLTFC